MFEIGQQVRVVRRVADCGFWIREMDKYVNDGKVYTVLVASSRAARFTGYGAEGWNFPLAALAPAKLRS